LTIDQYEEIKKVATYEVLPYETFLELFGNKTFEEMSSRVGQPNILTVTETEESFLADETVKAVSDAEPLKANPVNYDPRTIYPTCFRPARDQGFCGSCYAFSAAVAFESRICIASPSRYMIELSPQDIVSCDNDNMKCRGGYIAGTWAHLENFGAVSERCFPYVSGPAGFVPQCTSKCVSSVDQFYRFKANLRSYRPFTGIENIKTELVANGPMSTGMRTFEDFSAYKGGIYNYAWGRETDPHAVILVGYGVENGTNYWLIRNSWGTKWGENGYFRIIHNSVNAPEKMVGASSAPRIQ
jgi:C1A family cysteine protease